MTAAKLKFSSEFPGACLAIARLMAASRSQTCEARIRR